VKEVHLFFGIVLILLFTLSACVVQPLKQEENTIETNIVVAAGTEGVDIFDVSDPTDPKHLSHFNLDYRARNVFVKDKYSYVTGEQNGLVIIDISDPANPRKREIMRRQVKHGMFM